MIRSFARRPSPLTVGIAALLCVVIAVLAWLAIRVSDTDQQLRAMDASLAEANRRLSASGQTPVVVDGQDGEPGPAGPRGRDGRDGSPGVSGPAGPAGRDGLNGAPGADGQPGPAGPEGPAGPQGEDGAPGPQGPAGEPGPQGEPGRGIADTQCVGDGDDSHWQITYTDGGSSTSPGPCRASSPLPDLGG